MAGLREQLDGWDGTLRTWWDDDDCVFYTPEWVSDKFRRAMRVGEWRRRSRVSEATY